MACQLQGQNSVMHFHGAQRGANRLDTEIRVLSRKLPEQMTAGSEEGGGSHSRPAPQPACSPLSRVLLTLEDSLFLTGKQSNARSGRSPTLPRWGLISLPQACSHLAGAEKPVSRRRKIEPVHNALNRKDIEAQQHAF